MDEAEIQEKKPYRRANGVWSDRTVQIAARFSPKQFLFLQEYSETCGNTMAETIRICVEYFIIMMNEKED